MTTLTEKTMEKAREAVASTLPHRSYRQVLEEAATRFRSDVAEHTLTVLHDEGVYRHLLFGRPETSTYWFEIVTWPGSLTIRGDMGTYTFARVEDMLSFFREKSINPSYWSEKLQGADQGSRYNPERLHQYLGEDVLEWVEAKVAEVQAERDEAAEEETFDEEVFELRAQEVLDRLSELLAEVKDVLQEGEDEGSAHAGLMRFSFEDLSFEGSWEWDLEEFTPHFLWCCHALTWGVKKYDER